MEHIQDGDIVYVIDVLLRRCQAIADPANSSMTLEQLEGVDDDMMFRATAMSQEVSTAMIDMLYKIKETLK